MNIADIAVIVNGGGGSPTPTPAAGGLDFVFKVDATTSTAVPSLERGDFDKVAEKLINHEYTSGDCYYFDANTSRIERVFEFVSAEYNELAESIDTGWRTLSDMSKFATLIWERNGNVFFD